jgi:hypothetical protein
MAIVKEVLSIAMWSQTLPGRRVMTIFDSEPHTFTNVNAAAAAATAVIVVLFCGCVDAPEGDLKLLYPLWRLQGPLFLPLFLLLLLQQQLPLLRRAVVQDPSTVRQHPVHSSLRLQRQHFPPNSVLLSLQDRSYECPPLLVRL